MSVLIEKAAGFTRRIVNIKLELMAAQETHREAMKDLRTEMKSGGFGGDEVRGVMVAVKRELEPLEKATMREQAEEMADEIKLALPKANSRNENLS